MPALTKFALVAASAAALSGCISMQQQTVVPPSAPGPAIAVVRPVVVPRPAGPPVIGKTAVAGEPTLLGTANSVNPDCSPRGVPTSRVTQAPIHGTVRIGQSEVFPNFPPADPKSACNRMRLPGIVAEYTSVPGYVGPDFAGVEYIFPDGRDVEFRFAISVK